MEMPSSPLTGSWKVALQSVVLGIALTALSIVFLVGGVQNGLIILVLIGAAGVIAGPALAATPLLFKPGGYAPCPYCQTTIKAQVGDEKNLLCGGCGAYLDAEGGRIVGIETERWTEKPTFAAPTPWPDVVRSISKTIPLSAHAYVEGAIKELLKKKGVRMLDPRWPDECCVCGRPPVRRDQLTVTIKTHIGAFRDSEATLIANDIPYCAHHQDGIAFDNVSFASRVHDTGSFGIFFRSHGYREAFRRLNAWPWPGISPAHDVEPAGAEGGERKAL